MKFNFKEICKFLSGAFFVTAGASWYFAYLNMSVPFFNTQMTPHFLAVRGVMHFILFLATLYWGFIHKGK